MLILRYSAGCGVAWTHALVIECGDRDVAVRPNALSVGDDQGLGRCPPNRGQQLPLAAGQGNIVVLAPLEPKGTRHPAAPRFRNLELEPQVPQQRLLGLQAHHGFVVTVAVEERGLLNEAGSAA